MKAKQVGKINNTKYVVITPARNEEDNIEQTIKSMINQSVRPIEWIIVDDGSLDRTPDIVSKYSDNYNFIKLIRRTKRKDRQQAVGVINAFFAGYKKLTTQDWFYIVKMDGDLSFQPDYFERCFLEFEKDPKIGICGGSIYNLIDGVPVYEKTPLFHVRGATKIYKRECWDMIDPLINAPGWDTLDEVNASMLGWKTRSILDQKLIHLRPTGNADGSWKNFVKNGKGAYISGYHPLYLLVRGINLARKKPYMLNGIALLFGYIKSHFDGTEQIENRAIIRYLRQQQINRLIPRKKSIWI
jgi:glycosyltransferase involved in cell wall biosynthesis